MKVHKNWSNLDQTKHVSESVNRILKGNPAHDIANRPGKLQFVLNLTRSKVARNFNAGDYIEVDLTAGNLLIELAHREQKHREFQKRAIALLTDVYQTTRSQKVIDDVTKFMNDLIYAEDSTEGI